MAVSELPRITGSFESSMPPMQRTFSATTSPPSGFLPRASTSTPQSTQSQRARLASNID
jgi:hypothetical protein